MPQQQHPQADERQVEHQQQDVADVEAGQQRPHEARLVLEEQRSGLQAELLERGQQHRGGGGGRQPQREQRHQRPGGRGVVGGFGTGHAFDGAVPELLGMTRQALLDGIGEQRRQFRAAGRQGAQREADRRAAQPRLPRARPVVAVIQRVRSSGSTVAGPGGAAASVSVSPTAKRPIATMVGSRPSSRYGTPKVRRASPLSRSMPTRPSTTPTTRLSSPATRDAPSSVAVAAKARTMSAK